MKKHHKNISPKKVNGKCQPESEYDIWLKTQDPFTRFFEFVSSNGYTNATYPEWWDGKSPRVNKKADPINPDTDVAFSKIFNFVSENGGPRGIKLFKWEH